MLAIKGIKKALDLDSLHSNSKLKASISQSKYIELTRGSIYEWGIPWMNYGRIVVVRMIASLNKDEWVLWCHGDTNSSLNHESFIQKFLVFRLPMKVTPIYTCGPWRNGGTIV